MHRKTPLREQCELSLLLSGAGPYIFHEAQRGSGNPYEWGMIYSGMRRTISFAISADFVIWLFEQLAESSCVCLCRLLVLRDHRWQMEVGSKVRAVYV